MSLTRRYWESRRCRLATAEALRRTGVLTGAASVPALAQQPPRLDLEERLLLGALDPSAVGVGRRASQWGTFIPARVEKGRMRTPHWGLFFHPSSRRTFCGVGRKRVPNGVCLVSVERLCAGWNGLFVMKDAEGTGAGASRKMLDYRHRRWDDGGSPPGGFPDVLFRRLAAGVFHIAASAHDGRSAAVSCSSGSCTCWSGAGAYRDQPASGGGGSAA